MRGFERMVRNERGSALTLIAISLTALLSSAALAIDLGLLMTARAETQRLTDAAALAGASAFLEFPQRALAEDSAQARALNYATTVPIRGILVPAANVVIEVDTAQERVRVSAQSQPVGLMFARLLDRAFGLVSTYSAAEAAVAGGADCLKPWAIPDFWDERTGDDTNGDRIWSSSGGSGGNGNGNGGNGNSGNGNGGANGETWYYDPAASPTPDRYQAWDRTDSDNPLATGLGSLWRSSVGSAPPYDRGFEIVVKPQDPKFSPVNPFFYIWRFPDDQGGNDYRNNIDTCNPAIINTTDSYRIEPGDKVGPTRQGVNALIAQDPGAYWDGTKVAGSTAGNWRDSPRVFTAPLFDPALIDVVTGPGGGNRYLVFSDFAEFFLEGPPISGQQPVKARFIGFARGSASGGGTGGQLNKVLRLIE